MPAKAAVAAASDRELTAMERLLNLNRKAPPARPAEADVRQVPLAQLRPNPHQPRRTLDEDALAELIESIRARGIIQPLVARPAPDDPEALEIVVGERRFIAAGRAGLATVPCLVRKLDDREAFILSVAENVARDDLNPIDEAAAYRRMLDHGFAANQGEIAALVGVHRTRVNHKLRLLNLDHRIQEHVSGQPAGAVSLSHLEELARLRPGDAQHALYMLIVERGLSSRELRARVDAALAPLDRRPATSRNIIALQQGARIAVYPNKYTVRIPRQPDDAVDLPRIVADLERIVVELKARLAPPA
ncbi:MAG TPA: ParB/RepB/Spo0J family partition protein [Planctomycetota bacterium]|nr:ParB/RepB/Spo0J family partition protein [Planctomycetota bacterium]HRR80190.1 ParB/RepB/Spo0J family partition protein [Planctomycetota bacterium]HRT94743.1 ParB/RepB/Spo0J family partition protein [Planctomycetota bacterium]